jgi:MerR family transcriptional regulator, copper efflux regulator
MVHGQEVFMRIKDFEKATGLPRSAIRFYERKGLISPEVSQNGSGYRRYDAADVERAFAIRLAKGLGFSLKEIVGLIDAWDRGNLDARARRAAIAAKVKEIDDKLVSLRGMRQYLTEILDWIDAGEAGKKPRLNPTDIASGVRPDRLGSKGGAEKGRGAG